MQKLRLLALALGVAGLAASASAQTIVSANVTANTTWGNALNPSPIILQNPIFVKNNATLTILPGTIVRGQPRSGPVIAGSTVGTPGAVIVTQVGRIVANGTSTNPIIFTTAAVDNNDDGNADDIDANGFEDAWVPGDVFLDDTPATAPLAPINKAGTANVALWGSLVLLGNAPTNLADKCGVGYGKCTVEGFSVPGYPFADVTYGGAEPHDNSGSLKYVSLRHGGDELGLSNELNGISLAGVGDGTVIENVEIYANFDDGFEWFGGTVNGKNLAVSFQGDDAFDLDEGYTGVNQFLFAIEPFFNENGGLAWGSASGDKLGEYDGDNYRPDNIAQDFNVNVGINVENTVVDTQPHALSSPQMFNQTLLGSSPPLPWYFTPASPNAANLGIQMRNGFAGAVLDTIVVNTGTFKGVTIAPAPPVVLPRVGASETPGYDVTSNTNNGLVLVACTTLQNGLALGALESTAFNNGNALETSQGGGATSANTIYSASFLGLVNADQTFNPQGNAAGKLDASLKVSPINPRPIAGLTGTAGCVAPQLPGLSKVTYRGAFSSAAPTLWTTGWTALNEAGLLAN